MGCLVRPITKIGPGQIWQIRNGDKSMSKIMDNYIAEALAEARAEVRMEAIQNMLKYGVSREKILQDYSEEEIEKAEKTMLVQV